MSANASLKMPMEATYTAMTMILGNLKRIGLDPDDDVLVCCDYGSSWRKEYEKEYKGDRKQKRKESKVDYDKIFKDFNELLEQVDKGTDWHILKEWTFEADDWMAVASRFYKDKEVILLTADSDLEQMWYYDNVKIFSPHRLLKRYKVKPINFNVYTLIAKKIKKETADNLISPILNEQDYENRMKCINLIELPEKIENKIKERLNVLEPKELDPKALRGRTIRQRYGELYNDKSKILTYETCVAKVERKKRLAKKKKLKERLAKKQGAKNDK